MSCTRTERRCVNPSPWCSTDPLNVSISDIPIRSKTLMSGAYSTCADCTITDLSNVSGQIVADNSIRDDSWHPKCYNPHAMIMTLTLALNRGISHLCLEKRSVLGLTILITKAAMDMRIVSNRHPIIAEPITEKDSDDHLYDGCPRVTHEHEGKEFFFFAESSVD